MDERTQVTQAYAALTEPQKLLFKTLVELALALFSTTESGNSNRCA